MLKLTRSNARSWFKGADTTTLTHYLEKRYHDLLLAFPGHRHFEYVKAIHSALQASNVFFKTLYSAPLWLRPKHRDALIESVNTVLQGYTVAATYAFRTLKKTRFKFQPKFHMLAEVRYGLLEEKNQGIDLSSSPLAYSTQMDEDFVGRISQMSRYVASRTVHRKTIERYKLGMMSVW